MCRFDRKEENQNMIFAVNALLTLADNERQKNPKQTKQSNNNNKTTTPTKKPQQNKKTTKTSRDERGDK